MRFDDGLSGVLSDSYSRRLLVDILHGTDRVAQDVEPVSWGIDWDADRSPKASGRVRFVHQAVEGESWVPDGVDGVLSPFKATLLLTEEITVGAFSRRVQLGLFDVVSVPFARDYVGRVGARWVDAFSVSGDVFPEPDVFPLDDEFPGVLEYSSGSVVGGTDRVISSVVEVEVASLDKRVLDAAFRSPVTVQGDAWVLWRRYGLLPVQQSAGVSGTVSKRTWLAERESRLDAVQSCARVLGGFPVVDSFGQWVLVREGEGSLVELVEGESGTLIDLDSVLSTDGFYNVVVGDYETEDGRPIRAVWTASGALSPEVMKREFVRFHRSDAVRSQSQANAAVASVGRLSTRQEVDFQARVVHNPLLELGDRGRVAGVTGQVVKVSFSDSPVDTVVVRVRRSL